MSSKVTLSSQEEVIFEKKTVGLDVTPKVIRNSRECKLFSFLYFSKPYHIFVINDICRDVFKDDFIFFDVYFLFNVSKSTFIQSPF